MKCWLAREALYVFAHVINWNVPDSEKEAVYYPVQLLIHGMGMRSGVSHVGQDCKHCKDYGGVYTLTGVEPIMFMCTQHYLVSVQNYTPMVPPKSKSASTKLATKASKKKKCSSSPRGT